MVFAPESTFSSVPVMTPVAAWAGCTSDMPQTAVTTSTSCDSLRDIVASFLSLGFGEQRDLLPFDFLSLARHFYCQRAAWVPLLAGSECVDAVAVLAAFCSALVCRIFIPESSPCTEMELRKSVD